METPRKSIGLIGICCVHLNPLEAWDSDIFKSLIMLCWLSSFGDSQDTLLYRVFSAKYFLIGSILEAQIHPKCSYAWRSILQARGVIEKGAIWRVGDGQKIDVSQHHWLPDPTYSKIFSPRADLRVERVCDLFHRNTRTWNPVSLRVAFCLGRPRWLVGSR